MVEAFSKFSYCKKLPTSRKLCFLRLNGISWVRKVPSTVMVPNKLWSLFSKSGFANPWPLQNQIFVCRKTLAFISTPKRKKKKRKWWEVLNNLNGQYFSLLIWKWCLSSLFIQSSSVHLNHWLNGQYFSLLNWKRHLSSLFIKSSSALLFVI